METSNDLYFAHARHQVGETVKLTAIHNKQRANPNLNIQATE